MLTMSSRSALLALVALAMGCARDEVRPWSDPLFTPVACDEHGVLDDGDCCGNRVCGPKENPAACPEDCQYLPRFSEGDAADVCNTNENWTMQWACSRACGNGRPDDGEDAAWCPRDFGDYVPGRSDRGCGDSICDMDPERHETPESCPWDCTDDVLLPEDQRLCGDGRCEPARENIFVCPDDCPGTCGDRQCTDAERTCPGQDEPCDDVSCVGCMPCAFDCEPCLHGACCGDGLCDPGEAEATCPLDCATQCGNGQLDVGETCDDGEAKLDGPCPNCKVAACGDGFLHADVEDCDDGNLSDDDACTSACKGAVCGDGLVRFGVEACDDGNLSNDDACRNDCTRCGDGVPQDGEGCDDGNQNNDDACRNDCTRCGDGVSQPQYGEACDDGNQSNGDACRNDCTRCGDGVLQPQYGEDCDDGNQNDHDACHNNCTVCGDGVLQPGHEDCDDGNAVDTDDCSNECVAPRLVFITDASYFGKFGKLGELEGLEGADAKCKVSAASAGLPGTWRAWLSDGIDAPTTRFDKSFLGWYRLTDKTPVAKGWIGLTTTPLVHAIDLNETKVQIKGAPVWSNTTGMGASLGAQHCNNWLDDTNKQGRVGNSGSVDVNWTNNASQPCSVSARLYCVQQSL